MEVEHGALEDEFSVQGCYFYTSMIMGGTVCGFTMIIYNTP